MSRGTQLALAHPWWMWRSPSIVEAVAEAHLRHWLPLFRQVLSENRRDGRVPATPEDLAGRFYLCRNDRNVDRLQSASQLTSQLLLGLAYSLDVPVRELMPEWPDWVASAAWLLVERAGLGDGGVRRDDAYAYAVYRRQRGPALENGGSLELREDALEQTWRCLGEADGQARAVATRPTAIAHFARREDMEAGVLRFASRLGIVLEPLEPR